MVIYFPTSKYTGFSGYICNCFIVCDKVHVLIKHPIIISHNLYNLLYNYYNSVYFDLILILLCELHSTPFNND